LLVLATACGGERTRTLHALLVRPPHDTIRFSAPAQAHRCARGRSIVIEAIAGANGVLLWARARDSLGLGDYPPLTRGDSTTPRGAMVAVRWMSRGEDARGVTLDSGRVTLTRTSDGLGASARGSGLEPTAGQRVALVVTVDAVPPPADTVNCTVRL